MIFIITKDPKKYDDFGVPAPVQQDGPDLVCGYRLAILRLLQTAVVGDFLVYELRAIVGLLMSVLTMNQPWATMPVEWQGLVSAAERTRQSRLSGREVPEQE